MTAHGSTLVVGLGLKVFGGGDPVRSTLYRTVLLTLSEGRLWDFVQNMPVRPVMPKN
jgi:hypothetical protein